MTSRLVLVLGDLFIPDRAPDIPAKFKKLLAPGKIGQILCLGNLTDNTTYDFLRGIAPDLQIVKGDFDVEAPNLPPQKVVTHGSLRIGFTHGHTIIPPGDGDALLITARHMDVDVLLWGGTHRFEAYELEGKFFVNPGSATGAVGTGWWAEGEDPVPSFCLMDVQGDVLMLYIYTLKTDANGVENVNVEKISYRKDTGLTPAPSADPPHDPLATEIRLRAHGRTRFIFLALPSEERARRDYHTRGSDDFEQGAPDSLEDLAQAPIVSNEVRIAELMVDLEDFPLVVNRIESIWDDFDAADEGLIPWGLVTQEAEMSQRMREAPLGAMARLREARLRREEERARVLRADDTLTEGSF
ncbi:Vacuolar protein sorting-associated protein 29 [Xylographa parallela]|nr:Vacuolar protein sorting-associated protein 29 [Xylographa parallela]